LVVTIASTHFAYHGRWPSWARLVLRWASVSGFNSWCRSLISVCSQPATQSQISIPSLGSR